MFLRLSTTFFIFLQQNISILVVLMYSWQISVNMKKYQSLGDVYYGKQTLRRHFIRIPKANLSSVDFLFALHSSVPVETRHAGVQIAYYAIIFSQFSMMVLSVLLAIGVYTVSSLSSNILRTWKLSRFVTRQLSCCFQISGERGSCRSMVNWNLDFYILRGARPCLRQCAKRSNIWCKFCWLFEWRKQTQNIILN